MRLSRLHVLGNISIYFLRERASEVIIRSGEDDIYVKAHRRLVTSD